MADEVDVSNNDENEVEPKETQSPTSEPGLPQPESNEKSEEIAKPTANSDEPLKQPTSKEDVYKESERHKISPSPTRICRECLEASYGGFPSQLRAVSQDYFKPVFNNLTPQHEFDEIISKLILYCEKDHRRFILLWKILEDWSPDNHKKYYHQWQKALQRIERSDDWFNQNIYQSVLEPEEDAPQQKIEDELHPLATENSNTINKWFFSELDQQEQSLVLTVALFEGVNRKLLGELTNEIKNRLFDAG